MNSLNKFFSRIKDQGGTSIIIVALVMVVLIGFTAMAVDIGHVMATKNELQNIADAAALAAARKLGAIYQGLSYEQQLSYVCDPQEIIPVALDVADKNKASGTIAIGDVKIGQWDGGSKTLTETLNQPDAVKVRAAREGGNAITTFFARVFGINTFNVWADATAALSGKSTAGPGEQKLPIGISEHFFANGNPCKEDIVFHPSNDPKSCAGWTTYTHNPANDATLRRILEGDEGYQNDEVIANKTSFEFIGGDLSVQSYERLLTLYEHEGYDVDGAGNQVYAENQKIPLTDKTGKQLLYPDGNPRYEHHWKTGVVVYEGSDCKNPNKDKVIVGFAYVKVTNILGPPDYPKRLVEGKIYCNKVDSEDSRGDGEYYGVKGSIPGLVE